MKTTYMYTSTAPSSTAPSEQGATAAVEALAELQERLLAVELERTEERSEIARVLQERDQFAATIAAKDAEKEVAIAKAVEEKDQIIAATVAAKDAEKEVAIARAVQEAVRIERLAAMYVTIVT